MPSVTSNSVSGCSLFNVRKLNAARYLHGTSSTSTIAGFPDELLSAIFHNATHDFHDCYDAIFQATTISHVCQRWRNVSLSTSSLWTVIVLTFPTHRNQIFRTVNWLARSRSRPLHIYMDFRDPAWNWDEASHCFGWKNMENVMRLILPHAHRWQKVELLTDTWAPIFTFLSYSSRLKSTPMLEDVLLSRCNAFFAAKGELFRPAAMRLPISWFGGGSAFHSLRRVSLAGVHVNWTNSGLSGLLELELKYHASEVMPTLHEFCDIISACPELERLSILGWGPQLNVDVAPKQRTLYLPHLRVFAFGFIDVDYAIDLLSLFHFAALKTLSLEDISSSLDPLHPCDASRLLEYLAAAHHGSCTTSAHPFPCTTCGPYPLSVLSALELHGLTSCEASLRCFLEETMALDHLVLSGLDKTNLQAIIPDLITAALCPSLLDLKFNDADSTTTALLTSLPAGTVRNPHSPPMRVVINNTSEDESHDLVLALRAAGIADIFTGNDIS
ncbi:hypothetical protein DEU56DRAFT_345601 [Suillus clintonianus]|uniref:uncharacterized protein n=1 Tax=Suillus clintonianus TaxID=1904413 RepID=UPI001B8683BC|nr:uncharacterized protein DEU56DRAFT_345601 [Suillus clintonianus]KAG2137975.1 hypothetical protein DEU56DRAFT_345601 [Suillus clintonianus]